MAVKPAPLDTAHAIPELAALVKYVAEHGETTRAALLAALAEGDEKKAADIKSHIAWLVEKGHLIGFSDGMLTVPAKFPKHTPPDRKPAGEGRAPARPEEPADAQERVPPEVVEQSQEEPQVEIQEEVKKDETADQLAE